MSKGLLKSTTIVSSMTLLSRVMGFVRDTLVAQIYGATAGVDAFYIAFRIPNFMRSLFAEGSFSQAFVPVLSEYQHHHKESEVRTFISHMAGALGVILTLVTVVGVIAAPYLVMLFAPGYTPGMERSILATEMLRITFSYLMLISLTAFAGGILNTYARFSTPSFTPVLLNLCMIIGALGFSRFFEPPIKAQAWSVLVAGIVQFCFQLPFLHRIGFLVWPKLNFRDEGVSRVLKLMLPALFGASMGQLSLLINTIFVSFLGVGSVSWLYYSERLAYFPLGVFGVALATVILPHLSRGHHDKASPHVFAKTLDWGIRCNLFIGMPATVALIILAGPLITTLMQYGKFQIHDVLMTRESTIAYAIGLQSFMLVKVLSAGFYARQEIKAAVRIGVVTIGINILLNAVLAYFLAHAGLALAASLSSWINTGLLFQTLRKQGIYRFQEGLGSFMLKLLFANAMTALLLWVFAGDLNQWFHWHWQQRVEHICFLGIGAVASYVSCLWLVGLRFNDLKVNV